MCPPPLLMNFLLAIRTESLKVSGLALNILMPFCTMYLCEAAL